MFVQYSTDLSDIKWFQSGVLLEDKELVPHPASLHSLQQRRATCVRRLLRRFTQNAVRQEGQKAEDHGEQGGGERWKMQSVSHC